MVPSWLRVCLALGVVSLGCGSSDPGASAAPCVPDCRPGYLCQLGVCLAACNPECGPSERCTVQNQVPMCLPRDGGIAPTDAGQPATDAPPASDLFVPTDDSTAPPTDVAPADGPALDVPDVSDAADAADGGGMDGTTGMDTGADGGMAADGTVGTDTPALTDTPAATDTPAPTDSASASCGHVGEACCETIACRAGASCVGGMCRALTSQPGECHRALDCTGGAACVGPASCADRWCYLCQSAGGVGRWGTACTRGDSCASGVCFRGRCSASCNLGATGDVDCATAASGAVCVGLIYGLPPIDDAGVPSSWLTFGACAPGCHRNGDCPTGTVCLPTSNLILDRMDFTCGSTTRAGTAGTPCMDGSTCQSGLCLSGALPSGASACTAPCSTDADCPAAAPSCQMITYLTPSGHGSPGLACVPRTP